MSHHALGLNDHRCRIKCVIMKDRAHFRSPHLIELSSRANITIENVSYFFSDNIVHPNEDVFHLLKMIKHPSMFADNSSNAMLSKLARIVESKEDAKCNQEKCLQLAACAIADKKVNEVFNDNNNKNMH